MRRGERRVWKECSRNRDEEGEEVSERRQRELSELHPLLSVGSKGVLFLSLFLSLFAHWLTFSFHAWHHVGNYFPPHIHTWGEEAKLLLSFPFWCEKTLPKTRGYSLSRGFPSFPHTRYHTTTQQQALSEGFHSFSFKSISVRGVAVRSWKLIKFQPARWCEEIVQQQQLQLGCITRTHIQTDKHTVAVSDSAGSSSHLRFKEFGYKIQHRMTGGYECAWNHLHAGLHLMRTVTFLFQPLFSLPAFLISAFAVSLPPHLFINQDN